MLKIVSSKHCYGGGGGLHLHDPRHDYFMYEKSVGNVFETQEEWSDDIV